MTVNVASNAPASVTNTATVSGGGETNTANDTASDPTTIKPVASKVAFSHAAEQRWRGQHHARRAGVDRGRQRERGHRRHLDGDPDAQQRDIRQRLEHGHGGGLGRRGDVRQPVDQHGGDGLHPDGQRRQPDGGHVGSFNVTPIPVTALSASVATPSSPQSGNVTISYTLTDAESNTCSILVQYSPDGGTTWNTATAVSGQGDGTTGLASSPSGTSHTFVWASDSGFANAKNANVLIRITPTDTAVGTAGTSGVFTVNNYGQTSTLGLYDPATSAFYLRNTTCLQGPNDLGYADTTFAYGAAGAGWIPIAGDWDGNGTDTLGLYDPATSTFYLRNTTCLQGPNDMGYADVTFVYGKAGAGWIPIAGDWNGDGKDTIGLYDPATSTFYLRNTTSLQGPNDKGYADVTFAYGAAGAGWIPIAGDWNGDGKDTIGLYNPATSTFYLRNTTSLQGPNDKGYADVTFFFGSAQAGFFGSTGRLDDAHRRRLEWRWQGHHRPV